MKKLLSKAAIAAGLFASVSLAPGAIASVADNALPSLNHATNASIDDPIVNNTMNIVIGSRDKTGQQGLVGTLYWNSYNVGKDATVNYEFTSHGQTALNIVNASGGMSQIYGKITNSGCANCGYSGTGKVILLNPNGVLFGETANVNLNSFTVSTMNGSYASNNLTLTQNGSTAGIKVLDGAKIYGDKNVTFASGNIDIYEGSKISTNTGINDGGTAYGKVKLITADGVNFTYYNNGAVRNVTNEKASANKFILKANGIIESGNIDIRNYSDHVDAEVNVNNAVLKATKAITGNDGSIWLIANNKVVTEGTTIQTVNATGAENVAGGEVKISSGNKTSAASAQINAVGDINIKSESDDVVIESSSIVTPKNISISAGNKASLQKNSFARANNVTISGTERAQAVSSTINAAKDINITSPKMAWTSSAILNADNDINITSSNGSVLAENSVYTAKNNVNLRSKDAITSAILTGSTFNADKNVNVRSTGDNIILTSTAQFKPKTGKLNLDANKDVQLAYTSDLSAENTTFKAGENIILSSANGSVDVKPTAEFISAKKLYIQGKNNVTTTGTVDVNEIQTNINADNNVNVTLTGVGNRQNGLIAKAGNNMTVTTPGTLSVSSLISGKDMTINANKVIAGLPYTTVTKLPADIISERSYIEVGGEFTSNVTTDNYDLTASGELTSDGQFNQKHHIEYTPAEKILLVNKRPVDNKVTDPNPGINPDGTEKDVIEPGTPGITTPVTPVDPSTPTPTEPSNPPSGDPTTPTTPTNPGECLDDAIPDVWVPEETPDIIKTTSVRNNSIYSVAKISTLAASTVTQTNN